MREGRESTRHPGMGVFALCLGPNSPLPGERLQLVIYDHDDRIVRRLEQIFKSLGQPLRGKKCKGMEGLLEEGKDLMEEEAAPEVMDAALIAAAQRVEHYEMAAYGCLRTYAQLLGYEDAVALLQETLAEEEAADEKLTALGEGGINQAAVAVNSMDEDAEDE